jgi:quercetin dioxygenase-like cupin family protein
LVHFSAAFKDQIGIATALRWQCYDVVHADAGKIQKRADAMGTLTGFGSLSAIPEEKITDKITRRVLAGQKGMMVWWKIGAGTHVAAHSHPHEQLVWLLKGRMEFRIDKERRMLEGGGIVVIPGGAEHEGWCHEDTEVVDVFAPPREDFLAGGGPTWLHEK